ncbi:hypothetical protein OGAPHI_000521 [Ogataea philodendri]|uniref:Glycogen debranching enzyme n=1 Tax=Ogataea philodendri TaxID=1378263 RepID=A0A9P8T9F2_9ASCO|nr:uncharacterized protein OGAPHI_000521 [Ogataea philodendri]KAH3671298.1 hypothetical protein OGAPHI_000521 [Ogataea philodendri]
MARIVLLRIGDTGEPLVDSSRGVLTFPTCSQGESPLFVLRFYIVAGSQITNKGTIWTDVPKQADDPYRRDKYTKHTINGNFYQDITIDVSIYNPGSYCYYIGYNTLKEGDEEQFVTTRKFYFVVPPSLFVKDLYLPLNAVSMQSVVSKWMGRNNSEWDPIFAEISRKGYNMIHFTPLQPRGESNSPYSIYDNLEFDPVAFPNGKSDVQKMVSRLEQEYDILSMTDVVFNHTANNSQWIREHPEVGYNEETAPHLKPAIELDRLLLHFSRSMKRHGYPTTINNVEDLLKVMDGIKIHVLGDLKLWQYYVVDVDDHIRKLEDEWPKRIKVCDLDVPRNASLPELAQFVVSSASTKPFGLGDRFGNNLDIPKFVSVLNCLYGDLSLDEIKQHAHKILDEINLPLYKEYDEDNNEILEQLYNRIKYMRLEDHGPRLGEVTDDNPLTEPYFTRFTDASGRDWALANNGWIWGGNPLVDFASDQSKCYLRREVIVWGDCAKLRYGAGPDDSPYLWSRMIEYSKLLASLFHGFRIDNCHSTPLHVGEAMLDAARQVNPNLYVVAELFSGSEELDIVFVERLGISSLIREAMQAYSINELSRLVHRHGGPPIGSFKWLPLDELAYPVHKELFETRSSESFPKKSEIPIPEPVVSQAPHALFMDCTHDNETPNEKRTVEDTLPNAALVSFCSCAVGTTFGYDECYPKLLDVVNEAKKYTFGPGIGSVKAKLNKIRLELANQSTDDLESNEMHVHHEGQFITVHRTNAKTGKGYFLIARTKFYQDGDQSLAPIRLSGSKVKHLFAYTLVRTGDDPKPSENFLESVPVDLREISPLNVDVDGNDSLINLPVEFPQGSIAVLSTEIPGCDDSLDHFVRSEALEAAKNLTLLDINAILYRCESEERDASAGTEGVYDVPGFGRLVYAGIQGWISVLRDIIRHNDLAHPLSDHLRSGTWALDYIPQRLSKYESYGKGVSEFKQWLESRFQEVKKVPYFLVPRYFALVVGIAYEALRFQALSQMSVKIQKSTQFVQSLSLVSVQMNAYMRSASIDPYKIVPSMAAGLPHFSYDYMRCWGRDIFISLRGLLLVTERYEEAKNHILCFAMTLKHGLIPNLLGSGKEPRYNARDAAWWFLESVQNYVHIVPDGEKILDCKVKRRFPLDDTHVPLDDPRAFSYESTIREIIYEILSRHAGGLDFREANAGPQIDSQMKDEGFNISISVDWNTGLIHGGNQFNCGTWMDKMGESSLAGNKGYPGTPRDGAAVEINGLLKSTLRFVLELQAKGIFDYDSVKTQDGKRVTFEQWNDLLQNNFERCFYIPEDSSKDSEFEINPNIVNRRGIYKDLYKSGKEYEDYQLRGNFPMAIAVAPELFTPSRALKAIQIADKAIRGPIGLATLDPADYNYRPYYLNSVDSMDFATAKGRNYHQGPEWCWILGYYMRAFRQVHLADHPECSDKGSATEYLHQLLSRRLSAHKRWLDDSVWAGLTELTQKNGEFCGDSSPTQAWSASCLLDLYFDCWEDEKN